MVGAVAVADAAADADIVVDDRFAGTIEFDGVFGQLVAQARATQPLQRLVIS